MVLQRRIYIGAHYQHNYPGKLEYKRTRKKRERVRYRAKIWNEKKEEETLDGFRTLHLGKEPLGGQKKVIKLYEIMTGTEGE